MHVISTILAGAVASLLALPPLAPAQVPNLEPPKSSSPIVSPDASQAKPPGPSKQDPAPLTKADVETWLDGFLPYALQSGDVAGAVVVVVKDGATLLEKGYGYADVEGRKPVDPTHTLFRPGSVSKLFTWTAVMQQVEQGKLDLDTDVNAYLDFKIPPREGNPITLRDLLTHTAGFDEVQRALVVTDPKDLHPLGETLKRWVPPRVTAAGSTTAYSNYGAALAGYIVERVSGEPFDDYLERHIFAPLGMEYATFRQPLPERLQPWMANGYKLASGEAKPFEIVTVPPAGSLSASGGDMGRFMIAHLQNGAFGSDRILQAATAVKMHDTAAPGIAPLHRMLLGFYENDVNGHRVITHAGDLQWFHSELNLFINDGVGLFLAVNSLGKEGAAVLIRTALFQSFSDRYFPGPVSEDKAGVDANTAQAHARILTGHYEFSRGTHTTFPALLGLLGQVQVTVDGKNVITVPALKHLDGQPKKWREVAPFVWRNVAGEDHIAAKVENGRVVRFGYDAYPFLSFEPVAWWRSSGWLLPLWIGALVALALTTLAWPISWLVRRHFGAAYGLTGGDARAHRLVRVASALVLVTMLAVCVTLVLLSSDTAWAGPHMDGWISFLRVLSLIVFPVGALVSVWNAWAVRRSGRRRLAKLWAVVLAIACLTVLYVGVAFHVVGYSANY